MHSTNNAIDITIKHLVCKQNLTQILKIKKKLQQHIQFAKKVQGKKKKKNQEVQTLITFKH